MDDVKLAKLIDKIVKQRVTEILKSNQEIKKIIKEEVKSQLIGILLENKIDVSKGKPKRTSNISQLLNNNQQVEYPKIEKRQRIVERRNVSYSHDPVLNQILNETPFVNDSVGFTGNALVDSMGISNENLMYAQNVAAGMGKNVKIDINPNAMINENVIPSNAQFTSAKQTPHLKEYVGDDGLKYVDDRTLFQNESNIPVMTNPMATVNLERALNRNYKQMLSKMDEKAKKFRGAN